MKSINELPFLQEIYLKHKVGAWPDKGSDHSYVEVYAEILAPYRDNQINMLEIGLMSGESLRMWNEYFHNGTVYGMDCNIKPVGGVADLTRAIADGLNVRIGDATSAEDVENHFKGIEFSVVIDDASHQLESQLKTFHLLKRYMAKDSMYIIEDIQSIDTYRNLFENIDPHVNVVIIDRRHIKNRYDDVLVLITGF